MDRYFNRIFILVLVTLFMVGCAGRKSGGSSDAPRDAAAAQQVVDESTQVLESFLKEDKHGVLKDLISRAKGVMIYPSLVNASFFFSVGGGNAMLMVRDGDRWAGPAFFSKASGGYGLQAGVERIQGVMLFAAEEDVKYAIEKGALLEGSASAAIVSADLQVNRTPPFSQAGDIAFYAHSAGLYLGIAVNAGGLSDRTHYNAAYHGVKDGNPNAVLFGDESVPAGADAFVKLLEKAEHEAKEDSQEANDDEAK